MWRVLLQVLGHLLALGLYFSAQRIDGTMCVAANDVRVLRHFNVAHRYTDKNWLTETYIRWQVRLQFRLLPFDILQARQQ
jgi:hypothetical protein